MKILWFLDKQFDVSLDRVTWLEMVKQLQKDAEIVLVTGFKEDQPCFRELRQQIIYLKAPQKPFVKRIGFYRNQVKNFEPLIRGFQPTILLFNTKNPLLLKKAVLAKKEYGFRPFLDVRTLPVFPKRSLNFMERTLFERSLKLAAKNFEGITYITEEIRDYCQENFRLPFHKSEIWTSGVDINLFRPEGLSRPGDPLRIIYHGNMAENRGLANLIRALGLIKDSRVELILLGSGSGLSKLRKLASELRLDGNIEFHPVVPYSEVPQAIQRADAGVLPFPSWPGWNTSSPIKLFEYLACGKSVIVTRIPAHVNVLKGEEFAFWAEASNPVSIAKAIRAALDSRHRLRGLGQKAREFVEENYTWEKQAKKLRNFLYREEKTQSA